MNNLFSLPRIRIFLAFSEVTMSLSKMEALIKVNL